MFAVFGKCRPEEEKRRRLVYNKEDCKWYEDTRKWKRLSNARYQISPEYSSIETAEEFIRLFSGNPDIHIVGYQAGAGSKREDRLEACQNSFKRKQKC